MDKRISMVAFSYYPADPRVRREAEALMEEGMSVDILCLNDGSELKQDIVNSVNVYRIPIKRKRGGKSRYLLDYFCFFVLSFFTLSVLHIRKNYRIIHVHNMPDILVFCALIPRICGSKIILDLHDPTPEVFMSKYFLGKMHPVIRLLNLLEKLSIMFSDIVMTPNIAFRDLFVSRGCPRSKIHVVMNSPQESIFLRKCNKANLNSRNTNSNFVIMYHGSIVERNGLDVALEALSIVRGKIQNLSFQVYGEGDFVESFLKLRDQLRLDDIVFHNGNVSLETVATEIESIDVGIIPNKKNPFTDLNLPTRIFEYLCKSKPVIAPRTKGILDYFNEESIIFFEPSNARSLAKAILEVYSNPERISSVLKRGISVYRRNRWHIQRQIFLKLIGGLLKGTSRQIK